MWTAQHGTSNWENFGALQAGRLVKGISGGIIFSACVGRAKGALCVRGLRIAACV